MQKVKLTKDDLTVASLYDLGYTLAAPLLEKYTYPWEALDGIGKFLKQLCRTLPDAEYLSPAEDVRVARDATIAPGTTIKGPCVICSGAEVRPGAFIRGNVLVGKGAVVGNSTELKNCILFDRVEVPHFNYVGDSVLGYHAHLGAGAVTSNVKSDRTEVVIHLPDGGIPTERRKCGAMLGDNVEVGCNSVLNPGTVIGKNTNVYPLTPVRGVLPPDSICKASGVVVKKRKGDA